MGEEYNQVRNICPQTKRFRTATVKAKILNTERLSHIGLDMSELRCKDLANFQCCKTSQPLELSKDCCHFPNNQSGCSQIKNQDNYFGSVLVRSNISTIASTNAELSEGFEDRPRNHIVRFENVVGLKTSIHKPFREMARETNQHFLTNHSSKKFASRFLNFQPKLRQTSNSDTDIEDKSEQSSDVTTNSQRIINKSTWKSNKDFDDLRIAPPSNSNDWLYFVAFSTEKPMTKFTKKKEIAPRERFQKCDSCGNSFGTAGFKIHQPRCSQTQPTDASLHNVDTSRKARFREQERCETNELPISKSKNSNYIEKQKEKDNISESQTKFKPIVCDICNRQFGSHSILIHRPQCLKKWAFIN